MGPYRLLLPSLVSENVGKIPMVISQRLCAAETRKRSIDVKLDRMVNNLYVMIIYLE